jgi:hypothetical protein
MPVSTIRLALLAILAFAAGCTAETLATEKGDESELPVDGATDSFYRPTEHGALLVGSNEAVLSEDARFHAWTFELTEQGTQVAIATTGEVELDTVLYLYRRSGSSWGRYIARSDDASGSTTFSEIVTTLRSGEYRVIAKGYKDDLYGEIEVVFECLGAGCPTGEPPTSERLTADQLADGFVDVAQGASYISESDSEPWFLAASAPEGNVTAARVEAAFASEITGTFEVGDELGSELYSARDTTYFLRGLAEGADDDTLDDSQRDAARAFGRIIELFEANLTGIRVVKVGLANDDGSLASDSGLYLYFVVGRSVDGKIAGMAFISVET